MIPRALQIACEEDIEFRRSLPRDYLNHMGVAYSDVVRRRLLLLRYELHRSTQQYVMSSFLFFPRQETPQRQQFMRKVQQLMNRLMTYAPVDAAADQMAKKYIHDSLPPVLTEGSCLEQPCLLLLPPVFSLFASLVNLLLRKIFYQISRPNLCRK